MLVAEMWGEHYPDPDIQELRQFVRRPSKFRRLIWGLETIAHGYWTEFLTWRKGNSQGAADYRFWEFHGSWLAAATLLALCAWELCKPGVGR